MERLTRRRLLHSAAAGATALYVADADLVALAGKRRPKRLVREAAFDCGVMSGDPTHRAVTLWTRLGEVEQDLARVRLEVARDPDFKRLVARRVVPTSRDRDHTVKVRVGGLKPDKRYWYRFVTRTGSSPVGRTQTAPHPTSDRKVRFGFFSCQDWVSGYYGAYRRFVEEDLDFVLCLGDYVYERIFYPVHRPDESGANKDGDVKTLDEYRQKYRLYRSDADLQEMHRALPFLAMWDDHEVEDNYAGGDPGSDDWDPARKDAGQRAFHEYQPNLRIKSDALRTYRRLRFGRHVELLMLDQRAYRDDQPCGDAFLAPCGESAAPRDYLGRPQMDWLKTLLAASSASWKVIGNQLMAMPLDVAEGVPVTQDSWEGYQAERTELLRWILDRDVRDVAFLTGDIHTFFAGHVLRDGREGPTAAVEFVGGSTTSPGAAELVSEYSGYTISPDQAQLIADRFPVTNPWMAYAESRSHGVAVVEADAKGLNAAYLASRDVTTRDGSADVRVLQRFAVERGTPRVNLVS